MITERKIRHTLQQLGDTSDEVRAVLWARGIKGYRQNATCCPIALYLRHELDGVFVVGASEAGVGRICSVLPDACVDFIAAFDHGSYPELRA